MGAEAIAFDLAVELITKLSSFTLSQIGLCWNVKDDLHDLKSTVSTIKAVLLDAEERSVTSQLVKDWLEKLRDVLYDADDLLDDFSAEALRKDLLGGNKLTKEAKHQIKISKWTNCKNNFGKKLVGKNICLFWMTFGMMSGETGLI
ncbi:disease resistance protein RGA2-like [Gossypium arboreum]|uniref:disease resistance protein RGA2-like n=1 Tax=Gossypium arboreum TaxID=29729 RepID=UPI0022F16D4B|nr:disease resistance protein RGA2-like [Gossypium arboreum]